MGFCGRYPIPPGPEGRWRRELHQLFEPLACNTQRARDLFEDELPVDALRQPGEQWARQLGEARPAVGVRQIGLPLELADQVFRQRQRGIEALLERLAAL